MFDSFGFAALTWWSNVVGFAAAENISDGSVRAASCTAIDGTVETLVLYRSVFHEMLGEVEAKGNAVPNLQRQKSSLRDALSTAARSERASFKASAKSHEEKSTDGTGN
jgi:hypothetical protein